MKISNLTKDRSNYFTKFVAFFCTKWLIVLGCLTIVGRILDIGNLHGAGDITLFVLIIGIPLFYWWYHFTYLEIEYLFKFLLTFTWLKIRINKMKSKKEKI
jgi:hypothetical protein